VRLKIPFSEVLIYHEDKMEWECGEDSISGFTSDIWCRERDSTYYYVYEGFSGGASSSDPPTLVVSVS